MRRRTLCGARVTAPHLRKKRADHGTGAFFFLVQTSSRLPENLEKLPCDEF